MFRLLLLFSFSVLFTFQSNGQKSLSITFNHLLDGAAFELDKTSQNDLENAFKIQRLEYYISNFSIEHDGGQITKMDDLYFLIRPGTESAISNIDLGNHNVTTIEKVRFHFGIDYDTNHADPAQWPDDHALAPKSPSMHWGWASGYRFIALEGKSGASIDQAMEFHCIGDEFYKELIFDVEEVNGNTYIVNVVANYENLLKGIELKNGIIQHGNLGEIKTLANNMIEHVFLNASVSNTINHQIKSNFIITPNPTNDGVVRFQNDKQAQNTSVVITNILGEQIEQFDSSQKEIILRENGIYFASLIDKKSGDILVTKKIIVQ